MPSLQVEHSRCGTVYVDLDKSPRTSDVMLDAINTLQSSLQRNFTFTVSKN